MNYFLLAETEFFRRIKVVSVTLLALICLFSLFLVKLAYCEMKSKNDIL